MKELDVSEERRRRLQLKSDRAIINDVSTNYDHWMKAIANVDNRKDVEEIFDALTPAFRTLRSSGRDPITHRYIRDRIQYVNRLKTALEKKKLQLRGGEDWITDNPISQDTQHTPVTHQSTLSDRTIDQYVEQPIAVTLPKPELKPDWNYRPTLVDILDYYKYKGVVGEESISILQTLGAINKLCFGLESLSGSGKSYVVENLLDLIPEDMVYRMEMSSKTAEMYQADEINKRKIIYLPELQKAMKSNNPIIIEILKGLTEGKDVTRKVRNQSTKSIDEYVINGDKGVIFTLAVENEFKYDAEFSRRVFILQTDVSEDQTDKILKFKASKRHAVKQNGFGEEDYKKLSAHVKECLEFPDVDYENPFADYIAEQIPRTIRARSYDDYLFDLMDASAKFHFKDRFLKDNVLFLNIEDVHSITSLYWNQFCKGLLKIPVLGEEVMELLGEDSQTYSPQEVYNAIKENNPGYSFKMVEKTIDSLVDSGFVEKTDPKSSKSDYVKVKELYGVNKQFDWDECWNSGLEFMQQYHPDVVDGWLALQGGTRGVSVLDPLSGEKKELTTYQGGVHDGEEKKE